MVKLELVLTAVMLGALGVAGVYAYRKVNAAGGVAGAGAALGGAVVRAADGVASGVIGEIGALVGLAKPAALSDNPADCNTWGTNCTAGALLSKLTTSTRSIFNGGTPAANDRFIDQRADTVRYAGLPPSDWSGTGVLDSGCACIAAPRDCSGGFNYGGTGSQFGLHA